MNDRPLLRKGTRLQREGFRNQSVEIRRVAKDGSWIDVFVYDNPSRTSWTKRMPLPLGEMWTVLK